MSVKNFLTGLVAVIFSVVLSLANMVGENQVSALDGNYVDAITELKVDKTSVGRGGVLDISANFKIADGAAKAGDATLISLPKEAKLYATTPVDIPLKNQDGLVFGVAKFMPVEKTITIVYSKAVEEHHNIRGSLLIKTQIDQRVVLKSTKIDLKFLVNAQPMDIANINYIVSEYKYNPKELRKYGWQDPANDKRILYFIDINQLHKNHQNVKIEDYVLTDGAKIIPETIKIYAGKWKFSPEQNFILVGDDQASVPLDITKQIKAEGKLNVIKSDKAFILDLGDIEGRGFKIRYSVECDGICAGKIKNKADIYAGDELIASQTLDVSSNNSSGQANGGVPKKPEQPEQPEQPKNPDSPKPSDSEKPKSEPAVEVAPKSEDKNPSESKMILAPNTGAAQKSDRSLVFVISFVSLVGLSAVVRKTEL